MSNGKRTVSVLSQELEALQKMEKSAQEHSLAQKNAFDECRLIALKLNDQLKVIVDSQPETAARFLDVRLLRDGSILRKTHDGKVEGYYMFDAFTVPQVIDHGLERKINDRLRSDEARCRRFP